MQERSTQGEDASHDLIAVFFMVAQDHQLSTRHVRQQLAENAGSSGQFERADERSSDGKKALQADLSRHQSNRGRYAATGRRTHMQPSRTTQTRFFHKLYNPIEDDAGLQHDARGARPLRRSGGCADDGVAGGRRLEHETRSFIGQNARPTLDLDDVRQRERAL
jgi:hypothetical protein